MKDRDPDLARLVEAVKELASQTRHTHGCPTSERLWVNGRPPDPNPACTCGLADVLEAVRRAVGDAAAGGEAIRGVARELLRRARHGAVCATNVTQPAAALRGYAPPCTCGRVEAERMVRRLLRI